MDDHLLFWVGLSLLLTHEMDAIRAHEWRLFAGISHLPERQAYVLFTALHVPLYVALLWGLVGAGALSVPLALALDAFFVVHVVLHALFHRHRDNQFRNGFSWLLIGGAGLAGALDLLLAR